MLNRDDVVRRLFECFVEEAMHSGDAPDEAFDEEACDRLLGLATYYCEEREGSGIVDGPTIGTHSVEDVALQEIASKFWHYGGDFHGCESYCRDIVQDAIAMAQKLSAALLDFQKMVAARGREDGPVPGSKGGSRDQEPEGVPPWFEQALQDLRAAGERMPRPTWVEQLAAAASPVLGAGDPNHPREEGAPVDLHDE